MPDTPTPVLAAAHRRIRADVEQNIRSGAWKPGLRIPYEHELQATYGCSRMTVSRALAPLVRDGLIERRRRAGSFVAAPRFERATLAVPDMRAEVEAAGSVYRFDLVHRDTGAPTRDDRERMPGAVGPIVRLTCLHRADDRPYALEHRLIDAAGAPGVIEADFTAEPPGSWLLAHVPWSEARHRITAVNADRAVAQALAQAPGTACLSLERWTRRESGPITYVRQYYPGASFALLAGFSA